jgi:adenine-specific DNA-methyltransferase
VTWPRTVCSITGRDINGNIIKGDYGVQIEDYVEDQTEVFTAEGKKITKKRYQKVKTETMPELAKIQKSDGFATNAVFFKLGFLDKTKVSLGMQFKELLSTLWMKAGAIGKCPIVDDSVPDMLILPDNKMAILNDENQFSDFVEQLAQYPEIEVVYLVTDYESSFVAMTQALEGKKTYQLYRDYLDNFRINAGRNSR